LQKTHRFVLIQQVGKGASPAIAQDFIVFDFLRGNAPAPLCVLLLPQRVATSPLESISV
jgi:hypothetical protein